jgi:hypothetical protein
MDIETKAIELQKIFQQGHKTYWEETEAIKKYLETTEPVDVVLANVMQQRELLLAFMNFYFSPQHESANTTFSEDVEAFLANNLHNV